MGEKKLLWIQLEAEPPVMAAAQKERNKQLFGSHAKVQSQIKD